jgi:hypothetical protein
VGQAPSPTGGSGSTAAKTPDRGKAGQVPGRVGSRPATVMAEDSAGLPASPAGARASPNPAQHVGLEVSEILLARRRPMIMQVAHLA